MKKIRYIVLLLCLIAFSASGCGMLLSNSTSSYEIRQNTENIAQIELRKQEDPYIEETEVLLVLPEEDWVTFIDKLTSMECERPFGDGVGSTYGSLSVWITYKDGCQEVIGVDMNFYFTEDERLYGSQMFDIDDFRNLFSQYVDEALLPDWQ